MAIKLFPEHFVIMLVNRKNQTKAKYNWYPTNIPAGLGVRVIVFLEHVVSKTCCVIVTPRVAVIIIVVVVAVSWENVNEFGVGESVGDCDIKVDVVIEVGLTRGVSGSVV